MRFLCFLALVYFAWLSTIQPNCDYSLHFPVNADIVLIHNESNHYIDSYNDPVNTVAYRSHGPKINCHQRDIKSERRFFTSNNYLFNNINLWKKSVDSGLKLTKESNVKRALCVHIWVRQLRI